MLALSGAALFGASLLITLLVLPPLERQAVARGLVDKPGGRKDHETPVPVVGGIAVLLAVALPAVGGVLLALLGSAANLPRELG